MDQIKLHNNWKSPECALTLADLSCNAQDPLTHSTRLGNMFSIVHDGKTYYTSDEMDKAHEEGRTSGYGEGLQDGVYPRLEEGYE